MSEQTIDEKGNSTRDMVFNGPTHTFHGRTTMTLREVIAENMKEFEEMFKPKEVFIPCEGVGDNNGFWEMEQKTITQKDISDHLLLSQRKVLEVVRAWAGDRVPTDFIDFQKDLITFLDEGLSEGR